MGCYAGPRGRCASAGGFQTNPLYQAFVEAGNEAGYAVSDNMNSRQHEGFGPMEMNVGDGRRMSAARAYLRPAIARGNVRVIKGGLVDRVMFVGQRASGVVFSVAGKPASAMATREVILSAGAIMSPVILKRSGIGPAQELAQHGIAVIHDAPEVGENLMDHMELYLQMECTQPVSLFPTQSLLGKARIGIEWLATRRGLGATNHFESGGHIRSRAGIVYPDIQFHFLPLAISYDGQTLAKGHGFQVHVGTKRSKSRGWVRLRDALPQSMPRVRFNYMTHADDWAEFMGGAPDTGDLRPAGLRALSGPGTGARRGACRTMPPSMRFSKQKLESAYHPCGTCRMGKRRRRGDLPDGRYAGSTG